jgi:hypothetical protein
MTSLELTPQHFRDLAAQITESTADYLSTLNDRPVFPHTSGAETERLFATAEWNRRGQFFRFVLDLNRRKARRYQRFFQD